MKQLKQVKVSATEIERLIHMLAAEHFRDTKQRQEFKKSAYMRLSKLIDKQAS